jgi:hypothetical protein
MKYKFFVSIALFLLVIGFSQAQDKGIREYYKFGKIIIEEQLDPNVFTQAKGDKQRLVLMTCYASAENGTETFSNCIKLSEVSSINFWLEIFALLKTKVRFHFTWTGPEYYTHTTDWFDWNKNESSFLIVSTNTDWKKGIYTIDIIAETKEVGSGMGLRKKCVAKFF